MPYRHEKKHALRKGHVKIWISCQKIPNITNMCLKWYIWCYRTCSTNYVCMHEQMHTPDSQVRPTCASVRAYTNKSLNSCDKLSRYVSKRIIELIQELVTYHWRDSLPRAFIHPYPY